MAENKLTLESLAADVAALTKKVEVLASSAITHEVEPVEEKPVDISTLGFELNKIKYIFARPSVSIEEGGKFVTYKASEVAEDPKLQAKFAELAASKQTIFVVAQK